MKIDIYIKYRFRGNPRGEGEAAAAIEYIDKAGNKHMRKQQIRISNDTKNALALKICISAMRLLVKPCNITMHIDCDYLTNAYRQGWVHKWEKDEWKRANGKPPANIEEWKQFYMLATIHKLEFSPYDNRHDTELESILGGDNEVHGI